MNDDEIDVRLRDHGTSWRETNEVRPGIDWEAVTGQRSRNWFAVAGVSVAAAAIVVALVLGLAGVFAGSTRPATHKNAPTPAMKGAPLNFYAIRHNLVWSVDFPTAVGGQSATSDSEGNGHPVALGVANDVKTGYVRTAYAAYDGANCRTTIERHHIGTGESSVGGFTISGHAAATPMSVSPDGTKLALVVDLPVKSSGSGDGHRGCSSREGLIIVSLSSHSVIHSEDVVDQIQNLQWAPDSRHLAYLGSLQCVFCNPGAYGTYLVDTAAEGDFLATRRLLLAAVQRYASTDVNYADVFLYSPVFWWHGHEAVTDAGSLRLLDGHGGLGKTVATGLPPFVDSVSSDPTGNHLLLTSGDMTYRWDNGHLSVVKGNWTQPGW